MSAGRVLLAAAVISFTIGFLKAIGLISGLDSEALLFAGLAFFAAAGLV